MSKNTKLETVVKVSGERENVEILQNKFCDLFRCIVSPIRKSREGGWHVFITILEMVE